MIVFCSTPGCGAEIERFRIRPNARCIKCKVERQAARGTKKDRYYPELLRKSPLYGKM